MYNSGLNIRITSLYGSQPSSEVFSTHNFVLSTRINRLQWFQPSSVCFFFMQNSNFMTRLTSLYGSQTSSVVLSTHNSVLSTRINRLYWFQPSPVVLCMQNSDFRTRITSLCGSKTPPVVFAFKTATFGAELEVSMCPSSHLWFLHTQQRILDQNFKAVRVPDFICGFEHT